PRLTRQLFEILDRGVELALRRVQVAESQRHLRALRGDRRCLTQQLERSVQPSLSPQQAREPEQGLAVLWLLPEGRAVGRLRLRLASERSQRVSVGLLQRRRRQPKREGLRQQRDGLHWITLPVQSGPPDIELCCTDGSPLANRVGLLDRGAPDLEFQVDLAKVGPGRLVVRLELDRPAELSHRVEVPRLGPIGPADRVKSWSELRVDLQSVLQLDDRLVVFPVGVIGDPLLEILSFRDVRVLGTCPNEEHDQEAGRETARLHLYASTSRSHQALPPPPVREEVEVDANGA